LNAKNKAIFVDQKGSGCCRETMCCVSSRLYAAYQIKIHGHLSVSKDFLGRSWKIDILIYIAATGRPGDTLATCLSKRQPNSLHNSMHCCRWLRTAGQRDNFE
jgi:hypothetical protein